MKKKEKRAHCPICSRLLGLPVWLAKKYGRRFAAYCVYDGRAFKAKEIVWK